MLYGGSAYGALEYGGMPESATTPEEGGGGMFWYKRKRDPDQARLVEVTRQLEARTLDLLSRDNVLRSRPPGGKR